MKSETRPPSPVAGEMARLGHHMEECRRHGEVPSAKAVAEAMGWTVEKVRQRLLILGRITSREIRWSGVPLAVVVELPLGRLLDAARRHDPGERAMVLSYAATGRRPVWVDRCQDPDEVYPSPSGAASA